MKTRRYMWQLCISALLALAFLLAACGPTPATAEPVATQAASPTEAPSAVAETPAAEAPEPTATQPEAQGSTENVGTFVMPNSLPAMDPDQMLTADHVLGFQMYETLTRWTPDQGVIPGLATSWESNEDGTEWTYHLRQGVTFHDGTPFTAAAVKFSYDRTIEVGLMGYYFDALEEIAVVDDYTVRLKYSVPRPSPTLLSAGYGMFIVNPNIADKPEGWFEEGNDAGTGPYTLESMDPGVRWVLKRYDDYWGGWKEGQFDKVVFVVVEDASVREQMIRSGEADFTENIPYDSHASLEATGEVKVETPIQFTNYFIQFHLTKPPMDNLKFRQALAYAFPYESAQLATFGGKGTLSKGIVPAGLWTAPADMPTYTFDLDQAKALLAESGVAEGTELNLALLAGDVNELQMAQLWQAELAKIGVNLKIQEITNSVWWDANYNPDNEFDMMFITWAPGWASPYEFTILYDSVNTFTPFTGYASEEYDSLEQQALAAESNDPEAANQFYTQAQELLYDDAVATFILDTPYDFEYRSDIQGFKSNPVYWDLVVWYDLTRQ
jgi:peptide/nickel transport system substrate-binding protein